MKALTRFLGALLLAAGTAAAVMIIGMRRRSPLVLDTVRRVNRSVLNPRQMRSAGTPGSYASIVRHRGRKSGSLYETPVGATAVEDGFLIALPYGSRADWVKNVLAAGEAELATEGETHHVDQPELVPMSEVFDRFTEDDQRAHRIFAVDQCMRLHVAAN